MQTPCCSPDEVIFAPDFHQSLYCHLLCGLIFHEEIQVISSTFAHSIVHSFRTFELVWEELCSDLRTSVLSARITVPSIRTAMANLLTPNPEHIIQKKCLGLTDWNGLIPQLFPKCKYIYGIMTGSMEPYLKKLRIYAAGVPLLSADYGSSEGWIGANINPNLPPEMTTFAVLPNIGYFEFLPLEDIDLDNQDRVEPVGLTDVEIGEEYEVVVTNFADHQIGTPVPSIFAQACNHLGVDFTSDSTLMNEEKLTNDINLLYLSWSSGDIVDIKTGTTTTQSSAFNSFKTSQKIIFPNIVVILGFSSKLKAREIKDLICKVFGLTLVTSIYHLDKTAVFVQFSQPELVSEFLELISQIEEKKNDAIYVLHPLSQLLEGGSTRSACYEVYKEICASPISKVLFADQAEAVNINLNTRLLKSKAHENGSFANLESPIDTKTAETKQQIKSSPPSSNDPRGEMLDIISC